MSAELGGALGIALLGSVVTVVYRGAVAGALGSDLPPDALEAARDRLGGALSAAGALPHEIGAPLVAGARGAFIDAFQATALTSAAMALFAAAATALLLDRHKPSSRDSIG